MSLDAWRGAAALPPDALHDRIAEFVDEHRLAIAERDPERLRTLDATWRAAPALIDPFRVLRATGEIGLGLGTGGWTAQERELLVAEAFLIPGVPAEDAWVALAEGDRVRAEAAVRRAEAAGHARAVELRALRALLAQLA